MKSIVLRWLSATPFGTPVEPDVLMMHIGSVSMTLSVLPQRRAVRRHGLVENILHKEKLRRIHAQRHQLRRQLAARHHQHGTNMIQNPLDPLPRRFHIQVHVDVAAIQNAQIRENHRRSLRQIDCDRLHPRTMPRQQGAASLRVALQLRERVGAVRIHNRNLAGVVFGPLRFPGTPIRESASALARSAYAIVAFVPTARQLLPNQIGRPVPIHFASSSSTRFRRLLPPCSAAPRSAKTSAGSLTPRR